MFPKTVRVFKAGNVQDNEQREVLKQDLFTSRLSRVGPCFSSPEPTSDFLEVDDVGASTNRYREAPRQLETLRSLLEPSPRNGREASAEEKQGGGFGHRSIDLRLERPVLRVACELDVSQRTGE